MPLKYENPVILHLSDLHFGEKHITRAVGEHLPTEYKTDDLLNDLGKLETEWKPNLIVVSGDLLEKPPFNPNEEQYKATEFMDKLLKKIKIPKNRAIVVPGNHDIAWFEDSDEKTLIIKYSDKIKP